MVIHSESESETESDDLLDALEERLCGDLGLKPDWSRWTDDGWPEPDELLNTRETWSPFNRVSRKPVLR